MSVEGLEHSSKDQLIEELLRLDEGGVVRVGKSRISLDLIVEQHENGLAPEEMVRAYDTLVLADVYAVIAYYLQYRDEVRTYLKRRAEESETLRAKIEAERDSFAVDLLLDLAAGDDVVCSANIRVA